MTRMLPDRWTPVLTRVPVAGLLILAMLLAVALGAGVATSPRHTTGLAAGAAIAVISLAHPRTAMSLWLAAMLFIPNWIGIQLAFYLAPVTLVGICVLPGALMARTQMSRVDLAVGFTLVLAATQTLLGGGGNSLLAVMVSQWGVTYVIARLLSARTGPRRAAATFAWLMTLVAVFAIVEWSLDWHPFAHLEGPNPGENLWAEILSRGGDARSEAAFGHPIALGGALAAAFPIMLLGRARALWRYGACLILVLGVLTTLSRGPIIALCVTGILVVWGARNSSLGGRFIILGAGLGIAVAVAPAVNAINQRDAVAIGASSQYRAQVFSGLLQDLHPFGVANNVTVSGTVQLFRGFSSIDNAFLAVGARYGWVLPLVLALLLIVGIGRLVAQRKANPVELALLGQVPVLFTVALITQFGAVIWLLAGLAVTWRISAGTVEMANDASAPSLDGVQPVAAALPPAPETVADAARA